MRRPRASLVSLHSGGAGAPPGTTTGPCQELADGGPLTFEQSAGKARPGAEMRTPPVERREATLRDRKRGGHASQACRAASPAAQRGLASPCVSRRSAPLVGEPRKETTGLPGASTKNRGDGACSLHPSPERGGWLRANLGAGWGRLAIIRNRPTRLAAERGSPPSPASGGGIKRIRALALGLPGECARPATLTPPSPAIRVRRTNFRAWGLEDGPRSTLRS